MHHRGSSGDAQAAHLRDERALAVTGVDDPPGTQQLEPFTQRRAGHAEFFRQAPLGRQQLPDLEHAVDDQPLDAFADHVGDLLRTFWFEGVHGL